MRVDLAIRGQRGSRGTSVWVRSGRLIAGCGAACAVLAGCAAAGRRARAARHLRAVRAVGRRARPQPPQILIAEPSALKALDGQNIVIKPSPGSIQYLKGAQWADRLPKIVQARLAETFQRSGSFAGVGKPGEGLAIDYQVIAEIRVLRSPRRRRRAAPRSSCSCASSTTATARCAPRKDLHGTAPVSGSGNDAYVGALDSAFGEAARRDRQLDRFR